MADISKERLIDYFFADANVQRLVSCTATWQPLHICYPREVNITRFIVWLLDPSEGHGLGDLALQSLLTAAWWNIDEDEIAINTKRFLAPSNVNTEGFSSMALTTEVDLGTGYLDILAIDPNRRRYIAIENKFGAQQSKAQLKRYRKELEKLFPEFLGIYIFLDSNEADPDDKEWISVGYDWLVEFLRAAEQRESTADHVRQSLAQFRNVIEDEAEDATSSVLGRLVTDVAGEHPEVLALMVPWAKQASKSGRASMLAQLLSDTKTLDGKAIMRLFQLYWKRSTLWNQCIRQVQFAPFISAFRQRFEDLQIDPKRVSTAFSLARWESLVNNEQYDSWFFPACVFVRQRGDTFTVNAFLQLHHVKSERRAPLIDIAKRLRGENGMQKLPHDEQNFVRLKRVEGLPKGKAVNEAIHQLAVLQEELEPLR